MTIKPVPMPEAAEGVSLLFRLPQIAAMERDLTERFGLEFGGRHLLAGFADLNADCVAAGLKHGLRNPDGTSWQGDVDGIDLPVINLAERLSLALSRALFGDDGKGDANA